MPKKKSIKLSTDHFVEEMTDIEDFVKNTKFSKAQDKFNSWTHDYAAIRAHSSFERLVLDALTGAINNDTSTLSKVSGVAFPEHLTDEVCEYLVTGGGYLDVKGRDGLVKLLKDFVPEDHYLVQTAKQHKYKDSLDRLFALRNFAAHRSAASKASALVATGQERIASAGSWLKRKGRLVAILNDLQQLAKEIKLNAPY